MYKHGVVLGRFQPFHNGHLQYILQALEKSQILYIGVHTPGKKPTRYEPQNPDRFGKANNPYSFVQRKQMIKDALLENNVNLGRIKFVHFRPNRIKQWFKSVPEDSVYLMLIISNEDFKKVTQMRSQGLKVKVIGRKMNREYKGLNIRQKIKEGKRWDHLVPKAVAVYLKKVS